MLNTKAMKGDGFVSLAYTPEKTTPCQAACPLKIDLPFAIVLAKTGRKREALERLIENNPLPRTVSHLCPAPCRSACAVNATCTSPLVGDLLRGIIAEGSDSCADTEEDDATMPAVFPNEADLRLAPERYDDIIVEAGTPRLAVIGSSPTALSASYFLARAGCSIRLFVTAEQAGGWLMNSIASMNLPEEALRADLKRLRGTGIEFRLADKDEQRHLVENYRREGYDALLLVPSFFDPERNEALSGAHCEGIVDLVAFVRAASSPEAALPGRIAVMGSGREALAAGLLAVRRGCGDVTVLLYDTETHSSGVAGVEIEEARREGLVVQFADCCDLNAQAGGGSRFRISGPSLENRVAADMIVLDASLRPSVSGHLQAVYFGLSRPGRIAANRDSMLTDEPGVFCAEPEVPVNTSILSDLAAGRKAAEIVFRYINNAGLEEKLSSSSWIEALLEDVEQTPCAGCLSHLAIHRASCNGCLECVQACPSGALYAVGRDGLPLRHPWPADGLAALKPKPALDVHLCEKCGICTRVCPQGALEIRLAGVRPAVAAHGGEKKSFRASEKSAAKNPISTSAS